MYYAGTIIDKVISEINIALTVPEIQLTIRSGAKERTTALEISSGMISLRNNNTLLQNYRNRKVVISKKKGQVSCRVG